MKKFAWPAVSLREWLFVFALAILAFSLALLPTIWAHVKTPPGFWFVGFNFIHDPWDINVYLNALRQGFGGHWLYQNFYDSTSLAKLPIYFPYLFLGHLARVFSLPIPFIFHLASAFLTILFFFTLYLFLAFFFKEKNWRFLTLFLITFGGGIGWLFFPKIVLADIGFPDGTVFQTLHLPHFILNQTVFLATLLFSLGALLFRKWYFTLLGSLSGLFLASLHPYSLLVVVLVFLGYFLLLILARKDLTGVFYLTPQFFIWSAGLLFFYLLLRQSPYFASPGDIPSPLYLFLSYGLLSPLAVLGAVFLWREKEEKNLFLLSWLLFHPLAIYFPLSFHRLAIKGFFIILVIAAAWGLKKLGTQVAKPWPIYFLVLSLSIFTQLFITGLLLSPSVFDKRWTYLTREEKQAFDFLLKNSKEGEIVLASYRIGNFLPANTNNRVYLGHTTVKFNPQEREKKIASFYSGRLSTSARQFLKNEKIDYVFWGPEEKELGNFDLTKEPYLENIHQNGKVTIFAFREAKQEK